MKRATMIVIGLFVVLLVLSACGPAAPEYDLTNGQNKFGATCATCHGVDGKGMPNLGKDLTASQFVKDNDDTEMVAFLKVGRPASDPLNTTKVDMPPKGGNPALTDEDLLDIVGYVRSIQD